MQAPLASRQFSGCPALTAILRLRRACEQVSRTASNAWARYSPQLISSKVVSHSSPAHCLCLWWMARLVYQRQTLRSDGPRRRQQSACELVLGRRMVDASLDCSGCLRRRKLPAFLQNLQRSGSVRWAMLPATSALLLQAALSIRNFLRDSTVRPLRVAPLSAQRHKSPRTACP